MVRDGPSRLVDVVLMPGCDVVALEKPMVWKDADNGWVCDQATICRKCKAVGFDRLAEDATWGDAMAAVVDARPVTHEPSIVVT